MIRRIWARLPSYWRYARERPGWAPMLALARLLPARRLERRLNRAQPRAPWPVTGSLFGAVDLNAMLAGLLDDGMATGLDLPPAIAATVLDFARATPCHARDCQERGFLPAEVDAFNSARERDVIAAYYFESVEQCPAISRIAADPVLASLSDAYLGCAARLIRLRLWWSFPGERVDEADLRAAAQAFHFDMNGWRTLKFFFYLTDCDEDSGAHVCLLGTHRERAWRHQFTPLMGRSGAELEAVYGRERFRVISGRAGTGFVEDPFLFHKGSPCRTRPRLLLEVEYGADDMGPSYRHGRLG